MEQELVLLIRKLEGLAPLVWEMARRQVTIQAVGDLALGLLAGALGAYFCAWAKKDDRDAADDAYIFVASLALMFGVLSLAFLWCALTSLLNPGWAAFKLLLEQVR